MKRIYPTLHFGLILPFLFLNIFCCCVGGKAHAGTTGMSSYQSMAGEQSHSCCPSKKDTNTPKCNCHNISASASDVPKLSLSQKPSSSPIIHFVKGIDSFRVAFISSTGLSSYHPLPKSSQSKPPIYLLNRDFRL